jgi:hypothetical protein
MPWKYNPFTDALDLTGSGGASYIDGVVADSSLLPVTLGTPALDSVFLAKAGSGLWLISRRPAGLYVRVANNGVAADWTYLGAFPEVNADANWELYNTADPTKELKFDLSSISTGTTRTLSAPNASGTIALTSQLVDTRIYTSNDTWTKPTGAKRIEFIIISGGNGGGGGRRSDSSTAASGGSGGNGGRVIIGQADAAYFGATEAVVVGAGGAGAAARTANDTNGASGTIGGESSFGSIATVSASTGGGGAGTTAALGNTTATGNAVLYYGTIAATSRGGATSITANSGAGIDANVCPSAGGGGGSKSSAGVYYVGGDGGAVGTFTNSRVGVTAGGVAAANAVGGNGGLSHMAFFGTGGAGGSPDGSTGAANKGGNGGLYGGGGGGGSGSLNGAGGDNSGGNGAQGIVVITTYF